MKRQALRLKTFVVDKILGVHDSPHRIALGVAIGIFVAWTPTIGFQMALTVAIAALLRANKVVGVPLVWISNPATLWMYIPNYLLGCRLLGIHPTPDTLMAALIKAFGINETSYKERALILVQTLWDVLAPLMLGSVIIGLILGAISYVATRKGVQVFQARRAQTSNKCDPSQTSDPSPAGDVPRLSPDENVAEKPDEAEEAPSDLSSKQEVSSQKASGAQETIQSFSFTPSISSASASGATATSIGATQA